MPAKRGFDECPACGTEMDEMWRGCGDGDDLCDCDVAYDCPGCGKKWWDPCHAHRMDFGGRGPEDGRELVPDDQ